MGILDEIANNNNIVRTISKEKDKDHINEYYGPVTGKFLGYIENDASFRKRIIERNGVENEQTKKKD